MVSLLLFGSTNLGIDVLLLSMTFNFRQPYGGGSVGDDKLEEDQREVSVELVIPRFREPSPAHVSLALLERAGVEVHVGREIFSKMEELLTSGDAGGVVNAHIGEAGRGYGNYGTEDLGPITAAVLARKRAGYRGSVIGLSKLSELAGTCVLIRPVAVGSVDVFLGLRRAGGIGCNNGRFSYSCSFWH